MFDRYLLPAALALGLCFSATSPYAADTAADTPAATTETPEQKAWHDASAAMQKGPVEVPLLTQAKLELPKGYGYVPKAEGAKLMQSMGNTTDDRFLGLIFPLAEEQNWFVSMDYQNDGHTVEGNKFREKQGVKPIEVTGWIQSPAYEAGTHRLVWSVGIRDIGASPSDDNGVNYNTYVLGREGYISMDFITSGKNIEAEKPIAKELLAAVQFNEGRRYADFKPSTDKVAAYGLAALVGGVALKKLGLLALAGAFFAKFVKIFLLAGAALVAGVRKFFKRG
jgi:uncharacterized membrane-anchored protein